MLPGGFQHEAHKSLQKTTPLSTEKALKEHMRCGLQLRHDLQKHLQYENYYLAVCTQQKSKRKTTADSDESSGTARYETRDTHLFGCPPLRNQLLLPVFVCQEPSEPLVMLIDGLLVATGNAGYTPFNELSPNLHDTTETSGLLVGNTCNGCEYETKQEEFEQHITQKEMRL